MTCVALIAAVAENGCIGVENRLPWHLPADLKHFRQLTTGNIVIMGRKTYDSIGKPLPNRHNIVITRNTDWHVDGVQVAHSLDEALAQAQHIAHTQALPFIWIMGGAQIYQQSLALAQALYLTEVETTVTGDAFLPSISTADWQITASERHYQAESDLYYRFVTYQRR